MNIKKHKSLVSFFTITGLIMSSFTGASFVFADVTPAEFDSIMELGESVNIDKTVTTPNIPTKPDIIFLADVTGSMGGAIANVKTNAVSIMNTVLADAPDAQFGVAQYRDFTDASVFDMLQTVTADTVAVDAAITSWIASGGGDFEEAQLNALSEVATPPTAGFRAGSSKIIVWFGDAPGHDPSGGNTLASTIADLTAEGIKVVAVSVGIDFLDSTGQATAIAGATGGVFLSGVAAGDVADAILDGLAALPVTVTPVPNGCDPLVLSYSPASATVLPGEDANFVETITVPNDPLLAGTSIHCEVDFVTDTGDVLGTQIIWIEIPDDRDTVAPVAQCVETVNPAGKNIPKAGQKSPGMNEDGFYELSATDNEDVSPVIFARDLETGFVFGPFASPTKIKYTEANGAEPSQKDGSGVVDYKLKGQGDLAVYSVDAEGNISDPVTCLVPNPPK